MKLTDLLTSDHIVPSLGSNDKLGVLKELVELLAKHRQGLDKDGILRILLEREKLGSTGTGAGVAIPHGKADTISDLLVCFGRSLEGVEFDSIDGKPAHLFFLLVAPTDSIGTHLSALARISNMLNEESFRDQLMQAQSAGAIYQIIEAFDAAEGGGG